MRFKIILLLLLSGLCAKAQIQNDAFIKDIIESVAENLPEDFDLSELEEHLIYLQKHPININNTTEEDLNKLMFLSPLQISNFFNYQKVNGKFLDVLELQSIDGFDAQTLQKLLPFVSLNENDFAQKITLNNIRKFADHDLIVRFGQAIQKAKGYTDLPGSKYLGGPERVLLRYKFDFLNRLSASFILEKDAGEKFISEKQKLLDYQSANIALFNIGRFKKIVIGDYAMQFGQGLTLWSGFSFGKAPDVTSVAKRDVGLKPYTSSNEYSFFRGAATTVNLFKNINLTTFISSRKLDASIKLDQNLAGVLSNINQTGLHRTQNEINNQKSLAQNLFGGVLNYKNENLHIGAIGYRSKYNQLFIVGPQAYQQFDFTGKNLTNLGTYYTYSFKNFYFFGEFAKSINSGFAYVNGALLSLSNKVSAVVLHRNYPVNYYNFFNQATAEASEANNEKGLYVGLNVNPAKGWSIALYGDYFKFPWLKYRINAPSNGYEILGQLNYTPTKTFKAFLRYKTEVKQQNTGLDLPIYFLEEVKRESYRADASWKFNRFINLQNRIEVSQYQKGSTSAEFGYMIYQDISYAPLSSKLKGNLRIAYFNTASYNSRIYAYEDDVLYNFNFGMYNGKGFRYYINLKYSIAKSLQAWARYAVFNYVDTETVGTGLDEISGNQKTDFKLQMRYQF